MHLGRNFTPMTRLSIQLRFALATTLTLFLTMATPQATAGSSKERAAASPTLQLKSELSEDQDDMCVWVHPEDAALSTIITADKAANRLFVYDLQGTVLQTIDLPEPGNIDVRDNVLLGGRASSLVVVNQRDVKLRLRVFRVDLATRKLEGVDDGEITTEANYGGCLYHSRHSGKLYFISTTKKSGIQQYELFDNGSGQIAGKLVRSWKLGKSEGAVADDETGLVYIGEEERGIWKLGAEPNSPTPGELVIKIADSDLAGDIEGLALTTDPTGRRLLVLSDQGRNVFVVLDRDHGYSVIGTFRCAGAESTDGIEIVSQPLGPNFPNGLFCCHTDVNGRPTLVAPWERILTQFLEQSSVNE